MNISYSVNIAAVVNKTYILKILSEGSREIAPEQNSPLTLKLKLTLNLTLTLRAIVRIPFQRIVFPIGSLTKGVLTEISIYAP